MHPDLPIPAVFAHRGASAYAPENTLSAFQLAITQNTDGIELDVTLTADGQVVVIHDTTIDRTTTGKGRVKEMDWDTLRQFDAGSWFGPAFAGERIPMLDEVLELVGDKVITNIEIQSYSAPLDQTAEQVTSLVAHHGLENKIIFSSFNPRVLVKIHQELPSVPIGILLRPGKLGTWSKLIFDGWVSYCSIHPHYSAVTPQMIQRAKDNGHRVIAYTVNHPEEIRRLYAMGIDGIFTDDPELALKIRGEMP
jgi:glycerophosphoryl diester phosphodiesterase